MNIGNPGEFTILELAQTVIRVTDSSSELVYEALPVDDPQVRQPDITRAKQVLGLGARDPARGRSAQDARLTPANIRSLRRALARSLAATVVAAAFRAGQGSASREAPARPLRRPAGARRPDQTFPLLQQLRVAGDPRHAPLGRPIGVAKQPPDDATDPADPAYNWFPYDRAVRDADDAGIKVLFSIVDTPRWANGSKANRVPKKMSDLRDFAYAAAKRYSGTYERPRSASRCRPSAVARLERGEQSGLPRAAVREEGQEVDREQPDPLRQDLLVDLHRRPLDARSRTRRSAAARPRPRGNNSPKSNAPVDRADPVPQGLKKAGLKRFDAYAHHPYYGQPDRDADLDAEPRQEGPIAPPVVLGNIGDLTKV